MAFELTYDTINNFDMSELCLYGRSMILISSEYVETLILVSFGWMRQEKNFNLVDLLDQSNEYSFLFEHFVKC